MSRLQSWLLNAAYLGALTCALPIILWSAWKRGKYRNGFAAKFWGHVPMRTGDRPCIWLHAVSVGEVNLLALLIQELSTTRPELEVVLSTTTKTGYDLARKKYSADCVFYCPLDFSWAVRRAIRRIRPDLLILAELELWPQLISVAKEQGIQVAVVNGRLSDRSLRGYLRIQPLIARILKQVDLIAAQNEETAERFRRLGAKSTSVYTTGSLKFEGALTDRFNRRTLELRNLAGFTDQEKIFLAGSTQAPEEALALHVYRELKTEYPQLRLVLVPRHPERFDEVADLLAASGLDWMRRTELGDNAQQVRPSAVLLVDSIGELGAWWGVADVGFVGGSLGNRGGQNMLEPAAYGVPTCFGPNTWNFRDIVSQLMTVNGAVVVQNEGQLFDFVLRTLRDPAWAQSLGKRAQQVVLSQQGATARTVELLLPLVENTESLRKVA